MSYLERCSKAGNCSCIPKAEIDKLGQILGLPLKKVTVNCHQGTYKQGATGFPSSHACLLYTVDLLTISEALPAVIFIFLANMSKRLQMLNAVYILLNCAIAYAHLELEMDLPQDYRGRTSFKYSKQLSSRPPFLKKRSTNS